MPGDFSIDFVVERALVEIEADGEPCYICGDTIFLKAFRIQLEITSPPQPYRRIMHTPPMCQSCADAIMG